MSNQVQLLKLAEEEMLLYDLILSIQTPPPEKMVWLQQSGVFERYQEVHATYADLSEQVEALKRGLFLTWYSLTEHPALTGLWALSVEASNKLVITLQKRIMLHLLDYELSWMILYYIQREDFVNRFPGLLKSLPFLKDQESFTLPVHIDPQQMEGRGQMGIYWNYIYGFM